MRYKLTVHDGDDSITYESNDADKIIKQIESVKSEDAQPEVPEQKTETKKHCARPLTPYERCRNSVYATGNRWAIENFNATH